MSDFLQNNKGKVIAAVIAGIIVGISGFVYYSSTPTAESPQTVNETQEEDSTSTEGDRLTTSYNVDCPEAVRNRCVELAEKHSSNISHRISSTYRNMNGTAHKVTATSSSEIANTGSKTTTIMFDEESGEVWNIRPYEP